MTEIDRNSELAVIPDSLIGAIIQKAKESSRKRFAHPLRRPEDPVQIILNAIEPESYLRPHRHPDKRETRFIVQGKVAVVSFDDRGEIVQTTIMDETGRNFAVDTPPGVYDMLISLEEGSVVLAVIQGPYQEETHKQLAPWAPAEENERVGQIYLQKIKEQIRSKQ